MTTTSEAAPLAAAFVAGLILGWLYFSGLKLTVRRLPATARPARLFLLSLALRLAAMAAALYALAQFGRWDMLLACLLGVLGSRWMVVRRPWPGRTRGPAETREGAR